ncbi:hypothetical protein CLI64_18815 [Nostoc sp. CENA543]|nr:hypothetical protein CLI64_18815 [Nostoc sp. CENA543]
MGLENLKLPQLQASKIQQKYLLLPPHPYFLCFPFPLSYQFTKNVIQMQTPKAMLSHIFLILNFEF